MLSPLPLSFPSANGKFCRLLLKQQVFQCSFQPEIWADANFAHPDIQARKAGVSLDTRRPSFPAFYPNNRHDVSSSGLSQLPVKTSWFFDDDALPSFLFFFLKDFI